MDKMRMESVNMTAQNIEKVGALFPNCITESIDENGNPKKAINFEVLKQMLSEDVIEGDEAYEFTWVGKKSSIVEANKPTRKTLRPCKEESVNWDSTENLYIEGDNLEVLKLLQESYLGKVKMIYIDPPYNTGNDFIYNDDFKMTNDEYSEESGELDEQGNRLFKNTDTNGRFHSDWCSMIYSRLMLARNLIADDGVIFISIDDNEQENLKKICNEVFGDENFVAEFTVASNSSKNNAKRVAINHEYALCYGKKLNLLPIDWKVPKNQVKAYEQKANWLLKQGLSEEEIHGELLELVKYPRFYDFDHYTYADNKGVYQTDNFGGVKNGNFTTEIFHPVTGKPCVKPAGGWRTSEENIKKMLDNDEIAFGKDETVIPRIKRYLNDYLVQVPKSTLFFDSQSTTKWLKSEKLPFDFPKAVEYIKYILSFLPNSKDGLILDFFGGSATTAHAVMQLNAEDGGTRKFIMVQIPEKTDVKSEAFKAGYKNICEIGKERIRRAAKKIHEDNPEASFDDGFRVLKLDNTNMNDVYYSPTEYSQNLLSRLESNVKSDRNDLDLLFGCLLEWGLPLSLPYSSEDVDGCTIHNYNDGDLIACFDENVPESVIKEIAKRQPLRAVFRDSSFADSPSKINVVEIFKLMAPDTRVKVI